MKHLPGEEIAKDNTLKTSLEWALDHSVYFYGIPNNLTPHGEAVTFVMDPDGWKRSDLANSLSEPITRYEFNMRLGMSTCIITRT